MSRPWWWIDASRLLPLIYIFGACKGKPRSSKLNLSVRKAPTLKRQKIDLWRACPASSRHFASWWIDVEIEGAVRSGCVFWWFSSSFPPVLDSLCRCKFNSYFKGYPGSRINTNETVSQSAAFAHLSMPSRNLWGAVGGELKSNGCTAECGAQSGRFSGQKGPVGDAGADGGPLNSTQCQLHFFKPPPGTGAGTHGVDAAHLFTKNNSWQMQPSWGGSDGCGGAAVVLLSLRRLLGSICWMLMVDNRFKKS